MTGAVKIEPAKVRGFVDRVETLEKEKRAIGDDVRDVYDEAKKAGLNKTALRKIVAKRRAKAPDPQVEAAMHAYELALDEAAAMVSNGETSLREATEKTGFSKSAIQRRVSQRKEITVSGTLHDPETREIKDAAPRPCVDGEALTVVPRISAPQPAPECGEGTGNFTSLMPSGADSAQPTKAPEVPEVPDDLKIPAHLDRRQSSEAA